MQLLRPASSTINKLPSLLRTTSPLFQIRCFSTEQTQPAPQWPPHNVCSLPNTMKVTDGHIKLKCTTKRAASLLQELQKEAVAHSKTKIDDFRAGDYIEVVMKKRENQKYEERYKGVVLGQRNRSINSTFKCLCIISNQPITITFQKYQPDIKEINLIQQAFINGCEKYVHRSKIYYIQDKWQLYVKGSFDKTDKKYVKDTIQNRLKKTAKKNNAKKVDSPSEVVSEPAVASK